MLLKLITLSSKPSKHTITTFDIPKTLQELLTITRITLTSKCLACVVKIYIYKLKYIVVELSHLTRSNVVKEKKQKSVKLPLQPIHLNSNEVQICAEKEKNETKNETEEQLISDEFIEATISNISLHSFVNNDFNDLNSVEEVRNDSFEIPLISYEKRRKVDDAIEYEEDVFDNKIRNIKNILKQEKKVLLMQNEIERVFKRRNSIANNSYFNESVEVVRGGTSMAEVAYEGVENNEIEFWESSADSRVYFESFENDFVFDEAVKFYERKDKAKAFSELVEMANKGVCRVKQEKPYGEIEVIFNE